jgi:hypothetical protein
VSRILARVSTGPTELQEKYTPATFILVLITKCKLFYVRLLFLKTYSTYVSIKRKSIRSTSACRRPAPFPVCPFAGGVSGGW